MLSVPKTKHITFKKIIKPVWKDCNKGYVEGIRRS